MLYSENGIYFNSLAQFRLLKCGKRISAQNHSFGPAKRGCFWLIYVKSGQGTLYMNNDAYRVGEKNIMCTFPNVKFKYEFEGSCDIYWICFQPTPDAMLENFGIHKGCPVLNTDRAKEIESVFETLYMLSASARLKDQYSILSVFYHMFSLLTDDSKTIKIIKKNYIEYALHYIEDHYTDEIYVDDIASQLGIEATYFSKLFKSEIGETPVEYLSNLRMERAMTLLEGSDMSVKDVAVSVGIFDAFYFSRKFKAYSGFSPREYRKRCSI